MNGVTLVLHYILTPPLSCTVVADPDDGPQLQTYNLAIFSQKLHEN